MFSFDFLLNFALIDQNYVIRVFAYFGVSTVTFPFNCLSFQKWWHMLVVIFFNQVVMQITFTFYFLWLTCEMDVFHLFLLLTWCHISIVFVLPFLIINSCERVNSLKKISDGGKGSGKGKDTLCVGSWRMSWSLVLVKTSPSPKKGRPWCHYNRYLPPMEFTQWMLIKLKHGLT